MSRRPPRRNWRPSFAPDCRLGPPRSVRGPVKVPGLGDPNVRESNSVSVVDVSTPATPKLETFIRTGLPFGPTEIGPGPGESSGIGRPQRPRIQLRQRGGCLAARHAETGDLHSHRTAVWAHRARWQQPFGNPRRGGTRIRL